MCLQISQCKKIPEVGRKTLALISVHRLSQLSTYGIGKQQVRGCWSQKEWQCGGVRDLERRDKNSMVHFPKKKGKWINWCSEHAGRIRTNRCPSNSAELISPPPHTKLLEFPTVGWSDYPSMMVVGKMLYLEDRLLGLNHWGPLVLFLYMAATIWGSYMDQKIILLATHQHSYQRQTCISALARVTVAALTSVSRGVCEKHQLTLCLGWLFPYEKSSYCRLLPCNWKWP